MTDKLFGIASSPINWKALFITAPANRLLTLDNFASAVMIILFTVVVRLPEFGNPAPDFDEQLYYLAGERMWHGATPFVDIWDRKPVGLFLIYAVAHLLGGDGIIQYQLLAAAFAATTAWIIFLIAKRISGFPGALCAAAIYIVYLRVLLSAVGQAETFFMIFCVGAMYLTIRALETEKPSQVRLYGFTVMLLLGLGLQVKYTIFFQCIFFGLFFLWRLLTLKRPRLSVMMDGLGYIVLGLIPTLLVTAYYVSIDQQEAFVYANFLSNFQRSALTGDIAVYCIIYSLIAICPIFALGLYQFFQRHGNADQRSTIINLLICWALSGIAAIVLTSSVYIYYFIPVVPTLAILTGCFIDRQPQRLVIMPSLLVYASFISDYSGAFAKSRDDTIAINRMATLLKPYTHRDCIYVYDGPTILYALTDSCLPTSRPYPDHLSNFQEKYSMGLNQSAEVQRVLMTLPAAIVTANRPVVPKLSPGPQALVKKATDNNYSFVAQMRYDRRLIKIYLRNDLVNRKAVKGHRLLYSAYTATKTAPHRR